MQRGGTTERDHDLSDLPRSFFSHTYIYTHARDKDFSSVTNTSAIKRGTAAYVTNRWIDRNDSHPPPLYTRSKHFQPRDQFHEPIVNPCLPSVLTVPLTKVKRVLLDEEGEGGQHSELQLARLEGTRRSVARGEKRDVTHGSRVKFHFRRKDRAIFPPPFTPSRRKI